MRAFQLRTAGAQYLDVTLPAGRDCFRWRSTTAHEARGRPPRPGACATPREARRVADCLPSRCSTRHPSASGAAAATRCARRSCDKDIPILRSQWRVFCRMALNTRGWRATCACRGYSRNVRSFPRRSAHFLHPSPPRVWRARHLTLRPRVRRGPLSEARLNAAAAVEPGGYLRRGAPLAELSRQ